MTVSFLPENAPFNEEQRAWLNGFFAGMMGLADEQRSAGHTDTSSEQEPEEEEDFPWHDPALDMEERMKLAEAKPVERKMMAAMAQLDCGACGYLCQTYGEAIACGEETNLTLCVPGGKETSKKLKQLKKEDSGGNGASKKPAATNGQATNGWSRNNPFPAKLIESKPLNGDGSAKDTRHVAIDLGDSGLAYEVGDALGIQPCNCADLVGEIVKTLGADASENVEIDGSSIQLVDALQSRRCLKLPTEELFELLASCAHDEAERETLCSLVEDDSAADDCDVLDILQKFSSAKPASQAFVDALGPLSPRLYSIASSLKAHPGQVHLTVGRVSWERDERIRKGVASTMLADRIAPGETVGVFVQKSHGFTVPEDGNAPMIMVGPGTGVAPFLAFLQEREAKGDQGKNWLFFGDQHRATDYIYEETLSGYLDRGVLQAIDLAFSRDQEEKIYVQDLMRNKGEEIWKWLDEGGYFYVCGDASRMAVDVDKALHDIVSHHGGLSASAAKEFVKDLAKSKRYARDVY